MGYRGKLSEQQMARALRAQGWTLSDIAGRLAVSRSSVSLWVRHVDFEPAPRRRARRRGPNVLQRRKAAEIAALRDEGVARIGILSAQAFLAAGAALYAGEGAKTDGMVAFANSDPRMVALFCAWFRRFFPIEESRLSVRVYLHEGLDLDAAYGHWSAVTGIPLSQFRTGTGRSLTRASEARSIPLGAPR
jgi:Homeodomain-like domain